jgi:hypothetical protein
METFWDDSKEYFTGPPLTEEMIRSAESTLGYKLPDSYVRILRVRNGGAPLRCCLPTVEPTSWAKDHIRVSGIRGIGGKWGIHSDALGSFRMIQEWGYPNIGVVVGECPRPATTPSCSTTRSAERVVSLGVIHVETDGTKPRVLDQLLQYAQSILLAS